MIFADFGAFDEFVSNDDGEGSGPDLVDWIFMLTLTVVITMVMFNLIVSIFTDVYGTIKEN